MPLISSTSTNAPEFVDGEVEVSATTVRLKLWVNDVPNGGGTILQTDFFDYDERTTAFNFGVQNIYDSSTREFHLRNHGGYTNGSFPNQSYNNWGNLEIKSIEIEGGDGVFTLMNEYKRCSAYKWNLPVNPLTSIGLVLTLASALKLFRYRDW